MQDAADKAPHGRAGARVGKRRRGDRIDLQRDGDGRRHNEPSGLEVHDAMAGIGIVLSFLTLPVWYLLLAST
jgi:hypothetical protein